jgi:hypothetical protein
LESVTSDEDESPPDQEESKANQKFNGVNSFRGQFYYDNGFNQKAVQMEKTNSLDVPTKMHESQSSSKLNTSG